MTECTFDGCDRSVECRGLCAENAARMYKIDNAPETEEWEFEL